MALNALTIDCNNRLTRFLVSAIISRWNALCKTNALALSCNHTNVSKFARREKFSILALSILQMRILVCKCLSFSLSLYLSHISHIHAVTWPKCIATDSLRLSSLSKCSCVRARYTPVYRECNSVSRRSRQIFLDIYGTSDDTSASPLKISSPMARPSVQTSGNSGCLRYELTFRD